MKNVCTNGMLTSQETSDSILPDDVAAVLRAVYCTTADWTLSRQRERYNLTVRWQLSGKDKHHVVSNLKSSTKMSKGRRNNRRLKAFLQKKHKSKTSTVTTENTDEQNSSSQPIETEKVLKVPETSEPERGGDTTQPEDERDHTMPDSDKSDSSESSTASSLEQPEDSASTGTAGDSSNSDTIHNSENQPRMLLKKIVLDKPQQTYVMRHNSKKIFLLAREDSLKIYKVVDYTKDPELYNNIERSYKIWPDIRDMKNSLYKRERLEDVQKMYKDYNMESRSLFTNTV